MSLSANQQAERCRVQCREVLGQLSPSAGWIPEISAVPANDDFAAIGELFAEERPQFSFEVCCEDACLATAAFSSAGDPGGQTSAVRSFPALLLRTPPTVFSDLPLIEELAAAVPQLTVAVDHFLHVELLSRAAQAAGKTIGVLVTVDTGGRLMGVHPGPDCEALSRAVAKQRGLFLRGIFVNVEEGARVASERGLACVRTFELARACVGSLGLRGLKATDVVLGITSEDLLPATYLMDRCMVVWSLFPGVARGSAAGDGVVSGADMVSVRVISRPALEYCVIAAGSRSGLMSSETAVVWPAGAVISGWNAHHARVQLAGESLDLRIGSEVTLKNFHKHT
jgi:D-serine deaminase-like pyridoxal phosphate-dependent protein